MEDISKVGLERYRGSHLPNPPSNTKILFKTVLLTFKALYLLALALASYVWHILIGGGSSGGIQRRNNNRSLAGQVVLVTGGGNGFGRALCLELAHSEKCHVAVADLDYEAANVTANVVRSMGQKAFAYQVDVAQYDQVAELYQQVKRDLGTVDVLINNAGLVPLMSFQERKPEDVQRIMDVNVMAHFWTTRLFLPDMIAQKRGHIVGIASGFGLYPCGRGVTYTASKFAVRGFMAGLNEEISYNDMSQYIKTTTVYPLFMATREELTDVWKRLRFDEIYLLLTPEWCAKVAVDGIKNEYEHLTIPRNLTTILMIVASFPSFIRKRIIVGLYGSQVPYVYPTTTADHHQSPGERNENH